MASKIQIPAEGEGYIPCKDDMLFCFDLFYKDDRAVVACVVEKWQSGQVGCFIAETRVNFPYIPRFFCFREGPPILAILNTIQNNFDYNPKLILVEGHGTAHPVKCGLACWLGINTDIPVMGCAKSSLLPYSAQGLSSRGEYSYIVLKGKKVGVALITRNNVKPVFISPGYKIGIMETIKIILSLTPNFRIPEPLRWADYLSKLYAKGGSETGVINLGFL
ncbi:endonuclease V [candidate division KSB1 bacterium]|nr:endonuclease V [candidate division KSB1 bacterium]